MHTSGCAGGVAAAEINASLAEFNKSPARAGLPPVEIDSGDLIIHEPEQLFRPVLQKIVDVFRKHVDRIPNAKKPQSILLVGGFSSSQVLQARLEAEFGSAGVRVFPVLGAWQAVVKGAVLSAIKPRAFTRRMRHAFGFTTNEPWNAMLHGGPAVRAVDCHGPLVYTTLPPLPRKFDSRPINTRARALASKC